MAILDNRPNRIIGQALRHGKGFELPPDITADTAPPGTEPVISFPILKNVRNGIVPQTVLF